MLSSRRNFLRTLGAAGAAASLPSRFLSAAQASANEELQARLAADPLRPQFHLLPARNWMNDPDGPIFWKGQYHMFFQYNPHAAVWGDMHWAHAVSPDMIHWKHLPVALAPTPGGYDADGCFTGSAVDDNGTATFIYTGVTNAPPERATLRDGVHNFREVQCLAVSHDPLLRTWKKLPQPVLQPPNDPNLTGFRDPCLWRDGKTWYMGIGSGQKKVGGQVLLYKSKDLRHWEYLHPLASGRWNGIHAINPVQSGEMWECPDFFALGGNHVLFYSTEGKVIWEVGEFDPKELRFHAQKRGQLDYDAYYAPKSQLDARGNRILWGWIPESRPEREFSAAGWAGCMSLPRLLTVGTDGALEMRFAPVTQQLRGKECSAPEKSESSADTPADFSSIRIPSAAFELQFQAAANPFQMEITDGKAALVSINYSPERSGAEGILNFRQVPLPPREGPFTFHIFMDGSVVEACINQRVALTTRVYDVPSGPLRVEISGSSAQTISSLRCWEIKPISRDRLTT
jgi:beta-fructofuranosidase